MRVSQVVTLVAGFVAIAGLADSQVGVPDVSQVGVGVGTGVSIDVETVAPRRIKGRFVYSVKFACGEIPATGSPQQDHPLAPGSYRTAVNIHNLDETEVSFTKRAVIALPQNRLSRRGPISATVDERLQGYEALEVDCRNIARLFANTSIPFPPFAKGFVVIESDEQPDVTAVEHLDVVAVYTLENVGVVVDRPPPQGILCGDIICPPGLVCDPDSLACVSP